MTLTAVVTLLLSRVLRTILDETLSNNIVVVTEGLLSLDLIT